MGPAILLQLGFNSLLPKDYADSKFLDNAPSYQSWFYIILALGMGIYEFLKVLRKDLKVYELKEKIIYSDNSISSQDNTPIGIFAKHLIIYILNRSTNCSF